MTLFTPKAHDGLVRIHMDLNKQDWKAFQAMPDPLPIEHTTLNTVIVTDQYTGRKFMVSKAPCGLRCYCDAEVVREIEDS